MLQNCTPCEVLDSATKIPEGILLGHVVDLGNYDECLEVDVKEDWGSFTGQHCLASVFFKPQDYPISVMNDTPLIPFIWSMCVPSTCPPEQLASYLSSVMNKTIDIKPLYCHTNKAEPLLLLDWIAIAVLCVFGALCLLSTVYDLTVTKNRNMTLLAFSWYKNGRKILSTKPSKDTLECLHGLRFVSIIWVVLGHIYLVSPIQPSINIFDIIPKMRDWRHTFVTSALFSVETFLLLSGVLLSYVFLNTMQNGTSFNLPIFYLHRYLRVTPVLAVCVLVHAGLIRHVASGPLWNIGLSSTLENCRNNWWAAVLHIQNYVTPQNMCMIVTWYLSVDMQLYWLSPILLLPLFKRPKCGFILLQLVTLASVVSCFTQIYVDKTSLQLLKLRTIPPSNYFYMHTRATPWLIGLSLGYILFENRKWRKNVAEGLQSSFSKKIVSVGWLLSATCLTVSVITQHRLTQEDYVQNSLVDSLHISLIRLLWCIGVGWVIFACTAGCGGPVNTFLSWKFFQPLSRLTFCIYMIHMTTIGIIILSSRAPVYHSDLNTIMMLFSQMVLITLLAMAICLMFEAPAVCLEKILLLSKSKGPESDPEVDPTYYATNQLCTVKNEGDLHTKTQ